MSLDETRRHLTELDYPFAPGACFLGLTCLSFLISAFVPAPFVFGWLVLSFSMSFSCLVVLDIVLNRPFARPSAALTSPRSTGERRSRRVVLKLVGATVLFGIAFSVGFGLMVYEGYSAADLPPWWLLLLPFPFAVAVIVKVDALQNRRRDGLWLIGIAFVTGRLSLMRRDRAQRYLVFSILQGFFITFGILIFVRNAAFVSDLHQSDAAGLWRFNILFSTCIDLAKSTLMIGSFLLCTRFLNNHIRSIDRDPLSWIATFACYPPLFNVLDRSVGSLSRDTEWHQFFQEGSVLFNCYTVIIIVTGLLYATDMLVWGTRFSNLAFRGLVANGPFAILRHPAYVTKCLYFWLAALPFFAPDFASAVWQGAQLTLISVLYFVRAYLEQRHLRSMEEYRRYEAILIENRRRLVAVAVRGS